MRLLRLDDFSWVIKEKKVSHRSRPACFSLFLSHINPLTSVPLISFHWRHPHLRLSKPICAVMLRANKWRYTRPVFRSQPSLLAPSSCSPPLPPTSVRTCGSWATKLNHEIPVYRRMGVWKQINELINGRCYSVRSALSENYMTNYWYFIHEFAVQAGSKRLPGELCSAM